jgi:uncharacterized membrane protein
MRVPWKLVGLAGLAGVAATGAVAARRRRTTTEYDADELRAKLHERLRTAGDADADADPSAVRPD